MRILLILISLSPSISFAQDIKNDIEIKKHCGRKDRYEAGVALDNLIERLETKKAEKCVDALCENKQLCSTRAHFYGKRHKYKKAFDIYSKLCDQFIEKIKKGKGKIKPRRFEFSDCKYAAEYGFKTEKISDQDTMNYAGPTCMAIKDGEMCNIAGKIFSKSIKSFDRAETFLKTGCDSIKSPISKNGAYESCLNLGKFYIDKFKNIKKGLSFIKKSCDEGHSDSCLEAGKINLIENNVKKAKYFFMQGCEKKDERSCNLLKTLVK